MNILSTYYTLGTCVQCFHKSFCLILPATYWSEYYLFSSFCEETKTHTVRYIVEYYTTNKRQSLDSGTMWFHNTSVSLLLKYEISDMANTHCKTGTSQAPTESPSAFLELHTSRLAHLSLTPSQLEENVSHHTGILEEISSAIRLAQIVKEKQHWITI